MVVWIQHRQSQSLIRAQRELLDRKPESQRYWTGDKWSKDPGDAKLFDDTRAARQCRDAGSLCDHVPVEWQ